MQAAHKVILGSAVLGVVALSSFSVAYTDDVAVSQTVTIQPKTASGAYVANVHEARGLDAAMKYGGQEPSWLNVHIDAVVEPERHPNPEAEAVDENEGELPLTTGDDSAGVTESDEGSEHTSIPNVLLDKNKEECLDGYDSRDFTAAEDVDPYCLSEPKIFLTDSVIQAGDIGAGYSGDWRVVSHSQFRIDISNRAAIAQDIKSFELPVKAWVRDGYGWREVGSSVITERSAAILTIPAGERVALTVEKGGLVVPISDTDEVTVPVEVTLKVVSASNFSR